jgi:hypothetical protein
VPHEKKIVSGVEDRMKKQVEAQSKTTAQVDAAETQIVELSKRIEFYLTEYSVELLANKMNSRDFVIPEYQRAFTWESKRQSKFIESLLLGLPIPFLFFWERPDDGKLEIVDGSQRLRTIASFVKSELRLEALESLTHLSGFTFGELPESRQRKIKNRSIRGIVLNEHADEQARFDLFERINTGSKAANKAEVRRGALTGAFMELVSELAKSPQFVALAPVSDNREKARARDELVTRFFAYGDGLNDYKDRPGEFLFNYVKRMNAAFDKDPSLAASYKSKFDTTMQFVERIFPHGFRKGANGKATPNARFEAIAIGSRQAIEARNSLLSGQPVNVLPWLNSEEFAEITGADGANAKARLQGRMNFVRDKLLGA